MKYTMYILIILSLFYSIYLLINIIETGKFEKRLLNILGDLNDNYEKRIIETSSSIYIKNDRKSLINRLDHLIERSKIRVVIPFFSTEILIFISAIIALVAFFISRKIIKNPLVQLEAIILGIMTPIFILQQSEKVIFNKIDDNVLFLVDTALNFSEVKNDLIYILENTAKYLPEPLKTVIFQLVNEVRRGIPVEKAFKNLIDKVDNIRLKVLFKNMYTCSKETSDADYNKLFNKARNVYDMYYIAKEDRKSKVAQARYAIILILLVTAIILKALISISPSLITTLQVTFVGQAIVAYFGALIILAIYKMFSLEKFNY